MSIEFWFSIGSTYSYLSVMRLPKIEKETGIRFEWNPFSVRAIMIEMHNIPFAKKPIKAKYMWRDIERRASRYNLSPKLPAPYPLEQFDLANRVAVAGRSEGWCRDYTLAAYRLWFERGIPAGSEENLREALSAIGLDHRRVTGDANSDATARAYGELTDNARSRGIFGAPSFVVDGELFWGDDRLEDAIAWHERGSVA